MLERTSVDAGSSIIPIRFNCPPENIALSAVDLDAVSVTFSRTVRDWLKRNLPKQVIDFAEEQAGCADGQLASMHGGMSRWPKSQFNGQPLTFTNYLKFSQLIRMASS